LTGWSCLLKLWGEVGLLFWRVYCLYLYWALEIYRMII